MYYNGHCFLSRPFELLVLTQGLLFQGRQVGTFKAAIPPPPAPKQDSRSSHVGLGEGRPGRA